jgi:hypothetical protein
VLYGLRVPHGGKIALVNVDVLELDPRRELLGSMRGAHPDPRPDLDRPDSLLSRADGLSKVVLHVANQVMTANMHMGR